MTRAMYGVVLGALSTLSLPTQSGRGALPVRVATVAAASVRQAPEPVLVDWKMLNELNLETGKASPALRALDGKLVKIAAFIVPLEDDLQEADEFLLVPYFGACIHTPPPPANQMIYVKMPGHKTVKIGWWDPVMFEGVIHLWNVDSPYGAASYEMDGGSSAPYKPKAP